MFFLIYLVPDKYSPPAVSATAAATATATTAAATATAATSPATASTATVQCTSSGETQPPFDLCHILFWRVSAHNNPGK